MWRRDDGKMPVGRAGVQDDKSLRIDAVTANDEGTYVCEADNLVGSAQAKAVLVVNGE